MVVPGRLALGWVVSFLLVTEERRERPGFFLARPSQVRVVADPLRRALHFALGIADRELQATDHLPDQGIQLGLRVHAGRERRVGAGQVIRGWPGGSAALPGPATGTQPGDDRLLLRRLGQEV